MLGVILEIHSIKHANMSEVLCGETDNTRYIKDYVENEKIHAEFAVVEENYVDRDFCIDYSKYYSSSHTKIHRVCRRVHFFRKPHSGRIEELFESSEGTETLQKLYCGFTVIDGIYKDKKGCLTGHVGRTALCTYCGSKDECEKHDGKRSFFHKYRQKVSLFGHELTVDSLPFTSKDEDVGMCATAALWVAQFPLVERHGGNRLSQYEITDCASKIRLGLSGRRFPAGLEDEQIIGYLYERGYEVECLYATKVDGKFISAAIKTFVDAKIPIIASLSMQKVTTVDTSHGGEYTPYGTDCSSTEFVSDRDGHAVVISGYSVDNNGRLDGIYVHDDNIGPYARVKFRDGDVKCWSYKDGEYVAHGSIKLDALIIPIYPKVKLPYVSVLDMCEKIQSKGLITAPYEIILIEGKDYKKEILRENYEVIDAKSLTNKGADGKIYPNYVTQEVMKMLLPRFVWIVRCTYSGYKIDHMIDTTSNETRFIASYCLVKKLARS